MSFYLQFGLNWLRLREEKETMSDLTGSKIVKGVLHALKYLHDKNIVHRDMKPENILLWGRKSIETAKIWDFGLATVLKPGIEGLISELWGTYMYKAPEQLIGSVYSKVNLSVTLVCRYLGMRIYHIWNVHQQEADPRCHQDVPGGVHLAVQKPSDREHFWNTTWFRKM